jgi:hypothetical protein
MKANDLVSVIKFSDKAFSIYKHVGVNEVFDITKYEQKGGTNFDAAFKEV